jgi:hypothetical protein
MPNDRAGGTFNTGAIVRKKIEPKQVKQPKTVWHPLSLQSMPVEKLVPTINRILNSETHTVVPDLPQRGEMKILATSS